MPYSLAELVVIKQQAVDDVFFLQYEAIHFNLFLTSELVHTFHLFIWMSPFLVFFFFFFFLGGGGGGGREWGFW